MKSFFFLFFLFSSFLPTATSQVTASPLPINPKNVAVLYNNQDPQSEALAKFYASKRNIPRENLIGLELSKKDAITRSEYIETLQEPLRAIFLSRGWWHMTQQPNGQILPKSSKITTLVTVRGVPFKIKRENLKTNKKTKLPSQFAKANEASVDSELAMLGIYKLPTPGPINNPYFKKNISILNAKLPFLLLVGRIDAPSYATCKRMISDAIATESTGLWGMCYLDIAKKGKNYAAGDQWIEHIAKQNFSLGIPTVVDRNRETFVTNYPMRDTAIYFGWYTGTQNGPFLNKNFHFRPGAIAVHLHSFSASQLRNPKSHWTGPLLEKGAAATLGNVYEPYLLLTHHFDVFYDRLIAGYSLVEAAYMATPSLSWQNVVLGDPLYRPFLHLNGGGTVSDRDKDFRAIRVANQLWNKTPETLVTKIRSTAAERANARLYEYLGLWYRAKGQNQTAIAFFQTASKKHIQYADRLRQWLYAADIQRHEGNKPLAIATLKKAQQLFTTIPEKKSLSALLHILNPPPAKKEKKKKPVNKRK